MIKGLLILYGCVLWYLISFCGVCFLFWHYERFDFASGVMACTSANLISRIPLLFVPSEN